MSDIHATPNIRQNQTPTYLPVKYRLLNLIDHPTKYIPVNSSKTNVFYFKTKIGKKTGLHIYYFS
jgi:hypothetical protein